jgi:hypothetical protein
MPLPYPPPFMDLATLAEHICMGESTIERHVREGLFPPPTTVQVGKKLWSWKVVQRHLEGKGNSAPLSPSQQREGSITDAVRKDIARAHAKA